MTEQRADLIARAKQLADELQAVLEQLAGDNGDREMEMG